MAAATGSPACEAMLKATCRPPIGLLRPPPPTLAPVEVALPPPSGNGVADAKSAAEGGGTDFTHLFDLVLLCNLASLLPLLALDFLDEAPAVAAAADEEGPPPEGAGEARL